PYSINNPNCGHSFCAICLLKWVLASVHDCCGYWHADLMCPLCRAKLPDVPSTTPRSIQSFPFIPNRACKATASRLLSILAEAV
ncbi:hypothetical protein C8Q76DRAFT_574255, partial [Earliella scabrosa]